MHVADGYEGWPPGAPYERIIVTAAPNAIPDLLIAQLAEGGVLVAPVGTGDKQRLLRLRKHQGDVMTEDLGPVIFVPMLHGTE